MFRRMHRTTHLVTEYSFTQTTVIRSPSAARDNDVATIDDEGPTDGDSSTVIANSTSVQATKHGTDQESSAVNHRTDNVRGRAKYGSTNVV